MYEFDTHQFLDELEATDSYWKSFHLQDDFELGVLRLEAGQPDTQSPHDSDEVYFIVKGDGIMTINNTDHQIQPGKAFLVPKGVSHKLHSNTEPILAYYVLN